MLYLITGKPGSGKTLHMISMLMNRKDLQGRPLFIDGIPDVDPLKIPHEAFPENCTGENWHEWLPTNAILVVDECQRYWRPRANGSKVPDAIKEMEVHRHRGVDIFLITQHPRLIDINIKSFIENHKHFDKTQLGTRRMLEWQRCGNPDSKADIESGMPKIYHLDKKAFNVYKSAELHTKIKTNRTAWVWLFPLIIIGTGVFIYFSYSYNKKILTQKNDANEKVLEASAPVTPESNSLSNYNGQISPGAASMPSDTLKAEDFKPALGGKPWTAPFYGQFNKTAKTMPYPVACVKNGDKCTCYTDQATPIRDMDKGLCLDFVENGIYNPYLTTEYEANTQAIGSGELSTKSNAQISELSGDPLPSLSPANSAHLKVIQ